MVAMEVRDLLAGWVFEWWAVLSRGHMQLRSGLLNQ